MAPIILLAFILVPIAEIAVFIQAGELIGLWPTIAAVILTAIIGTAMLRQQGIATLMRLRATVDRGEMPLREVFDGACLLIAGVLLLTPGFLTDGCSRVAISRFTAPRSLTRRRATIVRTIRIRGRGRLSIRITA